jgi:molybdenum cofactor biosynthesis protein B
MSQASAEFIPTRIAILTVSSRRGEEDDTSGHWLRDAALEAGHNVVAKAIVKENRYAIRAQVSAWIASDDVQVVLITGGTGFTEGDQAPEALLPLFDREVEGFGEVFRMLSFEEIGTSTLQSRRCRGRQQHADFRDAGLHQSLSHRMGQYHCAAAGCAYASV